MKILEPAKQINVKYPKRTRCNNCDCLLEYEAKDVIIFKPTSLELLLLPVSMDLYISCINRNRKQSVLYDIILNK